MDANGLEQNVVLSQLKQCRSHMLTQRKRRQKNRLICIQLRLLRTRFEIKDTWIENDFDLFFWGGGGGVKRWDGKLCVPTEKSWLRPWERLERRSENILDNSSHASTTKTMFCLRQVCSKEEQDALFFACIHTTISTRNKERSIFRSVYLGF